MTRSFKFLDTTVFLILLLYTVNNNITLHNTSYKKLMTADVGTVIFLCL